VQDFWIAPGLLSWLELCQPDHQRSEENSMRLKKTPGVAIATAAAMLFGTVLAGSASAANEGTIHCMGVNGCKGQSACKSANNACKGQNSCKGKGFLEMTAKACADAQKQARDLLAPPLPGKT
jgi:hypothetical protein